MQWFLYNTLFVIGFTLMLPHFLYRMCKRGGYFKDFGQRLGLYDADLLTRFKQNKRIWVHAVSVGEVFAGLRLMQEIRARVPNKRFVLSVTTSTGHAIARKQLSDADDLVYFPLDFPFIIKRVLNFLHPEMIILVEAEFWPNLIRKAKEKDIPLVLVNGRISDSSYRGYSKLRIFTKNILGLINPIFVQSPGDKKKLINLGAPEEQIHVIGSAKYDVPEQEIAGEEKAKEVLHTACISDDAVILLGGSTWEGEEEALVHIYKRLKEDYPLLTLILVPRHAERSEEVMKTIQIGGLRGMRRTDLVRLDSVSEEKPDVLLVDTTGELKHFYACADIIFVGKSLTQHGGQNIIEPALYGKPILVGPNMENFPVVMQDFHDADAIWQIKTKKDLQEAVRSLLQNSDLRSKYGENAARLLQEKRGAIRETVNRFL
ncbi:MAG: glycosyltransferase [Kiritimatiellae bacterium]|nr:glycosyltransferase [Kiritimatiellia bacterium]